MTDTQRRGLDERTDADIVADVVACLKQVHPTWIDMFPLDIVLEEHVRLTLYELERSARLYGSTSETGCMRVVHDPDEGKTEWYVLVGYRYDYDLGPSEDCGCGMGDECQADDYERNCY